MIGRTLYEASAKAEEFLALHLERRAPGESGPRIFHTQLANDRQARRTLCHGDANNESRYCIYEIGLEILMLSSKDNVKSGLPKTAEWMICLPCLAFWPFLSALPAFSLFGPDLNATAITLNILLLVTGFWPLFLGFIAYKSLLTDAGRKQQKIPSGESALRVGYYATGWTLLYLALALSRSA